MRMTRELDTNVFIVIINETDFSLLGERNPGINLHLKFTRCRHDSPMTNK